MARAINHCIDCGIEVKNMYATRCRKCYAMKIREDIKKIVKEKYTGYCCDCGKKIASRGKVSIRCMDCYRKRKPWNYNGGKPKCEKCGKQLTNYGVKRCNACSREIVAMKLTGKKASKETREKLRLSHLGYKPTKETREKMSKSRTGEKHFAWRGGRDAMYERLKANPKYILKRRVSALMRGRLVRRIVDKECKRSFDILPYTVDELMNHLERRFVDGMGWHNMSEWHIDHILPDSCFKYIKIDDDEFKRCWALENLQPLWAKDNMRKNNRLDWRAA